MKVIVIDDNADDVPESIGIYTFEGFQIFLDNLMDQANATNDWDGNGRVSILRVVECNKNLNDMWDAVYSHHHYYTSISFIKDHNGKYQWYLSDHETHEESMKKIKELMVYEDPKVKQLEAEIEAYQKQIEYLKNHIKYMPDGEGAQESKEHFKSLAEKAEHLN